jgi:hypothetical protein
MSTLPSSLIAAVRTGDAVPLIGSGLSQASGIASWLEIINVLKNVLRMEISDSSSVDLDVFEVPDVFEGTGAARSGVLAVLEDAVGKGFRPNKLHSLLSEVPFRTALTTNWDSLLEDSLSVSRRVNVVVDDDSAHNWRESQATQVIKIHGSLNVPRSVIIALSDYARLYQRPSLLMSLIRTLISTRPTLAMGFGMRDPFLKSLFQAVRSEGDREHFVVVSSQDADETRKRYLEGYRKLTRPGFRGSQSNCY